MFPKFFGTGFVSSSARGFGREYNLLARLRNVNRARPPEPAFTPVFLVEPAALTSLLQTIYEGEGHCKTRFNSNPG
jgi:hypothetical protein